VAVSDRRVTIILAILGSTGAVASAFAPLPGVVRLVAFGLLSGLSGMLLMVAAAPKPTMRSTSGTWRMPD
jgi:hypothetical protein